MRLAIYRDVRSTTAARLDWEWSRVAELLTTPRAAACRVDDGSCLGHDPHPGKLETIAWSPVALREGAQRGNGAVEAVTALVLDLDEVSPADVRRALSVLEPYEYVAHSTHAHRPDSGRVSLRVVLPLSQEIPAAQWRDWRAQQLAQWALPVDELRDLSRIYFLPSHPADVAPWTLHHTGTVLEVRLSPAAPVVALSAPQSLSESPVVELDALRARLRAVVNPAHAALIARVLGGEPLGYSPAQRVGALADAESRDRAILHLTGLMAAVLPDGVPVEARLELCRESLSAMDHAPQGYEHWRAQLEKKMRGYAASTATERRHEATAQQIVVNTLMPPAPEQESEGSPPQDAPEPVFDSDGKGRAKQTFANTMLAVSARYGHELAYNAMTGQMELRGVAVQREHVSAVRTALGLAPDPFHRLNPSAGDCREAMWTVAHQRVYHPLQERLRSLVWDGTPRINTWLRRYLSVAERLDDGTDLSLYLTAVSRKWLLAAVARAMNPGCKVQNVLVLGGEQNAGKSSSLEMLALQREWFTDTAIGIDHPNMPRVTTSKWIIELAELSSLSRNDHDAQKGFFTRDVEHVRRLYEEAMIDLPRTCVFAGSTNRNDYLSDPTGNRRYWPVVIAGVIDLTALRADREQLWAEAVVAYDAGVAARTECLWWLTDAEYEAAKLVANDHTSDTTEAWREAIVSWLVRDGREHVTLREVCQLALEMSVENVPRHARTVSEVLRGIGLQRAQRGRTSRWMVPGGLRVSQKSDKQ